MVLVQGTGRRSLGVKFKNTKIDHFLFEWYNARNLNK